MWSWGQGGAQRPHAALGALAAIPCLMGRGQCVLKEFFQLRLEFYARRKAIMVQNIGNEILKLKNKVKFILAVISEDIVVNNRKTAELFLELKQKGYEPFPENYFSSEPVLVGDTEVDEENEDNPVEAASDYKYLLAVAICTLNEEKAQELITQMNKLEAEAEVLDGNFEDLEEETTHWPGENSKGEKAYNPDLSPEHSGIPAAAKKPKTTIRKRAPVRSKDVFKPTSTSDSNSSAPSPEKKAIMVQNIGNEILKLKNKVKFILAVISEDIVVNNRKTAELFLELKQKGYEPFPENYFSSEPVLVGDTEVDEENEDNPVEAASDYKYLLAVAICTLNEEKAQELITQMNKLEAEAEVLDGNFEDLEEETTHWPGENSKGEKAYNPDLSPEHSGIPAAAKKPKTTIRKRAPVRSKDVFKPTSTSDSNSSAPSPEKKAAQTSISDPIFLRLVLSESGIPAAAKKPKTTIRNRAPVRSKDVFKPTSTSDSNSSAPSPEKKAIMVQNIGNEILKLKNKVKFILAVISEDIVVNNRKTAELFLELKQKGLISLTDFDTGIPAAAKKPKTTIRKRAPVRSKDVFKPTSTSDSNSSAPSPEKKVRKMRASGLSLQQEERLG
ncbi:hypothetical protein ZWY2020_029678 [Hordeum vulgare]|nr:hypothetical protein ZWY2020_029678 [Hordeum vulgare]